MKRNKPQFSRLLKLDQEIRDGKYPNCLTFAREWEVAQKTMQRDIDYLKDVLGAPIEYDRRKKGYYYTDKTWFLPALKMSEDELLALLVAARAMEQYRGAPVAGRLEQIFKKLAKLIPDRISVKPELMFTQFSFVAPPAKPVDEKIWIEIVRGLERHQKVKVYYKSFGSTSVKTWRFAPYHIANLQGEWYVFGTTDVGDQVIQLSMARIIKAESTETSFVRPCGFNPKKLLDGAFGRFTSDAKLKTVRLLFNKEIADWVLERRWSPTQKTIRRKNGDIELSFSSAGLYEVFRWVLAWGHYVKVMEPNDLRKMVFDEIKLMGMG